MNFDRSLVRQRTERLLREVRVQRLEKRLRTRGEVDEDTLREGKADVKSEAYRVSVLAVGAVMAAMAYLGSVLRSSPCSKRSLS